MPELRAARVVTPSGIVAPGTVEIAAARVVGVTGATGAVPDRTLVPGFVDLQVNGHADIDVGTAAGDDWDRLDRLLLGQGVTAWCPALTSRAEDATECALAEIARSARRPGPRPHLVGVHLEGPFLSPDHAGAHPREHLRPVDPGWLEALSPLVRVVTIAPELPGALDAIERLAGRGVLVSLGHSGADAATARAAVAAGARLVTHIFNAMSPLRHREPGIAGVALADDDVAVTVIADLVHVDADVLGVVFRAKGPNGVALITDATGWQSPAIAATVRLDDGVPRLANGTLAGSALTMDQAVANVVLRAGVPLEQAISAASTVPSRLLGLADGGGITPGARADLVALAPDLSVQATWVGGTLAFGDE